MSYEPQFSRLIAIAMATGNNYKKRKITSSEIESLLQEYIFVKNGYSYIFENLIKINLERKVEDIDFHKQEIEEMKVALKKSQRLNQYTISQKVIEDSVIAFVVQRELGSQNENASKSSRDIARLWAILKIIMNNSDIESTLEKILNMEVIVALKSAVILLGGANKSIPKGSFDIENIELTPNLILKGISIDTLKMLASRLSADDSEYKHWHKEVLQMKPYYKKYCKLLSYELPLINLKSIFPEEPRRHTYLCPSPSIFMNSVIGMFYNILRNNFETYRPDIKSIIGSAYETYIDMTLNRIFVGKNVKISKPTIKEKNNADFIIETENAIWVIECKKSIGGVRIRTTVSPKDMIDAWERMLRGITQCAGTKVEIESLNENIGKPIITIVVVADDIIAEGVIFQKMAHESTILSSLKLPYLEILSLDAFERAFIMMEEKDLAEAVMFKWQKIHQGQSNMFLCDILDIAPFKDQKYIPCEFPHLTHYYEEIFGKSLKSYNPLII